ncbi:MAG: hypothetical protein LBP78_00375 [Acidaminococcales bacterium]|nr:hypothetical protein [Acidaminococcales bacterium]
MICCEKAAEPAIARAYGGHAKNMELDVRKRSVVCKVKAQHKGLGMIPGLERRRATRPDAALAIRRGHVGVGRHAGTPQILG